MPLPFKKNLDLRLIKLVQKNPILYNTKDPKYMDFDAREVVWQKIGDSLNRPGLVCKSRWINIRDMMRRRVKERLRNPNHRVYSYKYEDELTFMLPFFKDCIPSNSEEYSEFLDEESAIETPTEVFVNDTEEYEHNETKEIKLNLNFNRKTQEESSDREYSEALYQDLNPTDPIDVFLLTIGTTLRKFKPYYLNQAKSKIFSVVQDYELQQIMNKDDHPKGNGDHNY